MVTEVSTFFIITEVSSGLKKTSLANVSTFMLNLHCKAKLAAKLCENLTHGPHAGCCVKLRHPKTYGMTYATYI